MPCQKSPVAETQLFRGANDNASRGELEFTDLSGVVPAGPFTPGLARVVRALARLLEEDQYLAANDP